LRHLSDIRDARIGVPHERSAASARTDLMIEASRQAARRRLLPRALRLWTRSEAHQRLVAFEARPPSRH
jgi:hypothetical protein